MNRWTRRISPRRLFPPQELRYLERLRAVPLEEMLYGDLKDYETHLKITAALMYGTFSREKVKPEVFLSCFINLKEERLNLLVLDHIFQDHNLGRFREYLGGWVIQDLINHTAKKCVGDFSLNICVGLILKTEALHYIGNPHPQPGEFMACIRQGVTDKKVLENVSNYLKGYVTTNIYALGLADNIRNFLDREIENFPNSLEFLMEDDVYG